MKQNNVPGVSIVVIEKGEVKSHHEYGVKNTQAHGPIEDHANAVDDTTVFEAASLSKPVFAYGVLQLVEEGLLNLDRPLFEYLSYPYPDVEEDTHTRARFKRITARMVLAHTTGFPNWRNQGELLKMYFNPGERFSYSGEGFVYLQTVTEHLLGMSIEEHLQRKVLQPLGMHHSSFIWQSEYEQLKACGHDGNGIPVKRPKLLLGNAAFTLDTTALDYAKFVCAIMKGWGLKPETLNQMLTPQIRVEEGCVQCIHKQPQPGKLSDSISWGLGWGLQRLVEGDAFWHWGDNNGFKSYVVGLRKEKRGIIVFTNSSTGLGLSIIPQIIHEIWCTWQPAFDWIDTETERF